MLAYLRLLAAIIGSNFRRPALPYRLTFILTYRCNFKCVNCMIWETQDYSREMRLEEIDAFFGRNNRIQWLNIGGGEIFLRDDLSGIIRSIYKRLPHLVLLDFATTGFFVEKTVLLAEEIARRKPRRVLVTVSLDGPEELHERLRGVPGSWKKAVETFKRLKGFERFGIKPYFGYTFCRDNADSLPMTIEEVRGIVPGITPADFHLNLAQTSDFYYRNSSFLDKDWAFGEHERISGALDAFLAAKKGGNPVISFLENAYQNNLKLFLKSRRAPLPCKALSASCFIDPYWNVYPCVSYNAVLGNLRERGFKLKEIWGDEAVLSIQEGIAKGACPQCWTPCEAYQTIFGNALRAVFKSA